jgi:hypothetical protein
MGVVKAVLMSTAACLTACSVVHGTAAVLAAIRWARGSCRPA